MVDGMPPLVLSQVSHCESSMNDPHSCWLRETRVV
jgi:hypothetical protein